MTLRRRCSAASASDIFFSRTLTLFGLRYGWGEQHRPAQHKPGLPVFYPTSLVPAKLAYPAARMNWRWIRKSSWGTASFALALVATCAVVSMQVACASFSLASVLWLCWMIGEALCMGRRQSGDAMLHCRAPPAVCRSSAPRITGPRSLY